MLYLFLAILSSAGVSLIMRLSVGRIKNNITMLSACYMSCTLLALIYTMAGHAVFHGEGMTTTITLGILAGFLLLLGFVYLQTNIRINGVVLSAIFAKLGVLVPTVASVIVFGERPKFVQTIGFILAVFAILLINSDGRSNRASSKIALVLLLFLNGIADSMAKVYEELGNPELQELYLLLSFLAAFILSALLALYKKQKITLADAGYGLILGIPNYYSVRFLIKALESVPAVAAYPTYSVATILIITTVGIVAFKERITKHQKIAVGIILAALILLNI